MKKQILAGVLSATMVVGMGGVSVFAADNADDKTYNIGICQLVQHEALDAATQGFKDAITEELGDKVTFDEQNAQGDSNTCSTIITDFVSDGVDLILANATPALQAAAAGSNAQRTVPGCKERRTCLLLRRSKLPVSGRYSKGCP